MDIDLNVTNLIFFQKYMKLHPDSVDTFNSQIRQNMINLWDILHYYKLFFNVYFWAKIHFSYFKSQLDQESQEGYAPLNFFSDFFWFKAPQILLKHEIVRQWWTAIWYQIVPQIKKLKNRGYVLFNFLIQGNVLS